MLRPNEIRKKLGTSPFSSKLFPSHRSKSEKKQTIYKPINNSSTPFSNIKNQEQHFKNYFDNLLQANNKSVYYERPYNNISPFKIKIPKEQNQNFSQVNIVNPSQNIFDKIMNKKFKKVTIKSSIVRITTYIIYLTFSRILS